MLESGIIDVDLFGIIKAIYLLYYFY